MRHYIYFLSLLLLMAGCQSNKKNKETILVNNEETWTDEYTSDSQDAVWYNVQSDTIRCADGTVIYWHEQVQSSPFHRLTEMYRPANRLMAQTALQYGRATDQILLYEYGKAGHLQCIHDFCSADFADNQDELDGLKRVVDSLYLHMDNPVYEDEWDYIDYRVSYDKQGNQSGLHSKVLGKSVSRDTFGPSGTYEVKVLENSVFWQSDLHGGTLLVCQLWDTKDGNLSNYTGIRALAVNLKKIWSKQYKDGQLVKVSFYHRENAQSEEKVHTVERVPQPDGSNLYVIHDYDDIRTEYLWKDGLPVKCTKTSRYNTVLYKADFSVEGKDIKIDESVYNYRLKKLEKQPVKYQSHVGYDEDRLMDVTRMIWDEYDSDVLPPESYLK